MRFKNIFLLSFLILAFFTAGCASSPKAKLNNKKNKSASTSSAQLASDAESSLRNIDSNDLEEYVQPKGVVFGKTDFQGVLKAIYVKLVLENLDDPSQQYQLYVGDPAEQGNFPWSFKTVGSGYFFIELPAGKYKISSVSIPVGSTQAMEDLNIRFEVGADAITYIGTLKMIGTKEKIKLGGVPVIRPGFEYSIEINDEQAEGKEMFNKNYPGVNKEILINLMKNSV